MSRAKTKQAVLRDLQSMYSDVIITKDYKYFSKNCLVIYEDLETEISYHTEAYYDYNYKAWVLAKDDDEHFFCSEYQENGYMVTHWMYIPEKKGTNNE